MAQVLLPPQKQQTNLLDAIGRVLQGYQAYTGARKDSAQQDLINQELEDKKAGFTTEKDLIGLAEKEATFSKQPSEGALLAKTRSMGDVYIKLPNEGDSKLQNTSYISSGGKPVTFDPRTGQYAEGDIGGVRLANKPDGVTAYQQVALDDRKQRQADAKQDKLDKTVERFGKDLESPRAVVDALNQVESTLGFSLDDYDSKTGMVNGKKVDLPGASVPGLGRVSFYNADARDLEGSVARVFNVELKDRSGAAVTNPEMARLKAEFGSGKWNSEGDLIKGIKRYKEAAGRELARREAGYSPDVVAEYRNRGGSTLADFQGSKPKQSGKNLVNDGLVAAPSAQLSQEDEQALKWATSNPKDPRSMEIRKRLGR